MAEKKEKVRGVKAGPAVPVTFVPTMDPTPTPWEQAEKLAANPAMVVPNNNPLADTTAEEATMERIARHNMRRLEEDARNRRKPGTGNVYAGFMANRFGG